MYCFNNMKTTKQLASELGIIRKRSKASSSPNSKRIRKNCQLFSYLIVLDYESTCWQEKHRTQEIIEFPAVLMDTSNGEIKSEFHYYVQPQENTILSDFCKELTGISQNQVDNGIPLSMCLKKFTAWLCKLKQEECLVYNDLSQPMLNTCTFLTWSDWDLAVCLQYECKRKQLRKPPELNSWIDLRATYRKFYDRKPQGLNGALQDLGIHFEGRQHSGLDDARNTSRLAWRMICDGCVLNITKTLNDVSRFQRMSHIIPCAKPDKVPTVQDKIKTNELASRMATKSGRQSTPCPTVVDCKQNCQVKDPNEKNAEQSIDKRSIIPQVKSSAEYKKGIIKTKNVDVQNPEKACISKSGKSNQQIPIVLKHINYARPGSTKWINEHGQSTVSVCSKTVFKKNFTLAGVNESVKGLKDLLLKPTNLNTKGNPIFKLPTPPQNAFSFSYKTPTNMNSGGLPILKKTPPLCQCGRRANRKFVQSPGPNMGRAFYCCPKGRRCSDSNINQNGCHFFKWENASPLQGKYSFHNISRTSSEGSLFDISPASGNSSKSRHSWTTVSPVCADGIGATATKHNKKPLQPIPQPNFNTPSSRDKPLKQFNAQTLGVWSSVINNPFNEINKS